jgi:hypothetical protein
MVQNYIKFCWTDGVRFIGATPNLAGLSSPEAIGNFIFILLEKF